MSIFTIIFSYLRSKWSNTLLHITVMMLGFALMTSLLLFSHQMKTRIFNDGAGVDAVVGAKGSGLQLVLSSVQHVDIPTGNITLADYEFIRRHRMVKKAIPISLGDNYKRFRIVGSEPAYINHFNAKFASGKIWTGSMQAVIGANVEKETGLKLGYNFAGAHGLMNKGDVHDDSPYEIVGVLKPTGTVLDRLVVTSLDSVWDVHADHDHEEDDHDHNEHNHREEDDHNHDEHEHLSEKEITAILVKYRSRSAALSFPRMINSTTSMQVASPAFEMARLLDLVGVGSDMVLYFSIFLVSIAIISVLIGLLNSIRDRRYDLAIFRMLGGSRIKIMAIVLIEGMLIIVISSLLGVLAGHIFMELIGSLTNKGFEIGIKGFVLFKDIWIAWVVVLLLSIIVCLIPAFEAYKTDIKKTLNHV